MGHGGNRAGLIGCGLETKIIGKHLIIGEIQREGMTLAHRPSRV